MPTLDDLNNRLNVLERDYNSLSQKVSDNSNQVHNLDTRVDSVENTLVNHSERIGTLELKVEDHEKRLLLIEQSKIEYSVTRLVKYPKKADHGFYMYMPQDLTVDIFMEYNSGVIKQKWNWVNKIFNPQGYGKVSFDLDRDEKGRIKSLVLGQNTRVVIPSGIVFKNIEPHKSVLKVANEKSNSINSGLVFGIEILESSNEALITVFNPSSETIVIKEGDILVQVLHLFSYHTVPELKK